MVDSLDHSSGFNMHLSFCHFSFHHELLEASECFAIFFRIILSKFIIVSLHKIDNQQWGNKQIHKLISLMGQRGYRKSYSKTNNSCLHYSISSLNNISPYINKINSNSNYSFGSALNITSNK